MKFGNYRLHQLKPGEERAFFPGQASLKSLMIAVRNQPNPLAFEIEHNLKINKFYVRRKHFEE